MVFKIRKDKFMIVIKLFVNQLSSHMRKMVKASQLCSSGGVWHIKKETKVISAISH